MKDEEPSLKLEFVDLSDGAALLGQISLVGGELAFSNEWAAEVEKTIRAPVDEAKDVIWVTAGEDPERWLLNIQREFRTPYRHPRWIIGPPGSEQVE